MKSFRDYVEALKIYPGPDDEQPDDGLTKDGSRYRLKPGPLPPRMPIHLPEPAPPRRSREADLEAEREREQFAESLARIRYKERSGMAYIEMVIFAIQEYLSNDLPAITVWDKLKHGEYYDDPKLQKLLDMIAPDYARLTVPQFEQLVKHLRYTPPTDATHGRKLGSVNGKLTDKIVGQLVGNTDAEWWRAAT